jgi:hypothetical protein
MPARLATACTRFATRHYRQPNPDIGRRGGQPVPGLLVGLPPTPGGENHAAVQRRGLAAVTCRCLIGFNLERLLRPAVAFGRHGRPVRVAEAGNDPVVLLHGRDRTLAAASNRVAADWQGVPVHSHASKVPGLARIRHCWCSSCKGAVCRPAGDGHDSAPGASAREGVPWPVRRSPHGERRIMAPAGRYSMKALIRARGTLTHWLKWNARPASAIPSRGNHQRLDAALSHGPWGVPWAAQSGPDVLPLDMVTLRSREGALACRRR